jgi:hypothetical protein
MLLLKMEIIKCKRFFEKHLDILEAIGAVYD